MHTVRIQYKPQNSVYGRCTYIIGIVKKMKWAGFLDQCRKYLLSYSSVEKSYCGIFDEAVAGCEKQSKQCRLPDVFITTLMLMYSSVN